MNARWRRKVAGPDGSKFGWRTFSGWPAGGQAGGRAAPPEEASQGNFGQTGPAEASQDTFGQTGPAEASKRNFGQTGPAEVSQDTFGQTGPAEASQDTFGQTGPAEASQDTFGQTGPSCGVRIYHNSYMFSFQILYGELKFRQQFVLFFFYMIGINGINDFI